MEKERYLAANHVKSYGFKREISADNNMWLTHPNHLKVNKKKNSGSLQTGKNILKSWDREMVPLIGNSRQIREIC